MELLQQLVVSGGPAVAALAVVLAVVKNDLKHLKESMSSLKQEHKECLTDRRTAESDLHDRVTGIAGRTSRIEGVLNGRLNGGAK